MYAGPSARVEPVARIRHELGLDQPLWVQYFSYMGRTLHGDLGFSYRKQVGVTQLILGRLPFTAALTLGGIFVELAIGLPVGIVSAVGRGRWADRLGMGVALVGGAAPPVLLGLLLLCLLGYGL